MPRQKSSSCIRRALAHDTARIASIARAAYSKYLSRIGREPAPMVADFAGEIAANHVVVIETAEMVTGYMIGWPKSNAYFIDNIAIDPAWQGKGLGRRLIDHAMLIETHRAWEEGFHRVYLRLTLPEAGQ